MKTFIASGFLALAMCYAIAQTGFQLPTSAALSLLLAAIAADTATTYLCLKRGGKETNPIVGFLMKKLGLFWTFAMVWIVWAMLIHFNYLRTNISTQTAISVVYWLVPVNNVVVFWRLGKKEENSQRLCQ